MRLTQVPILGQGGLLATLAAVLVLLRWPPPRLPRWAPGALATCVALPILAQFLLSAWYLFSPTYIDHIEASVASITQYFLRGLPVYPRLDSYTFHGLLYGPLLSELNSLGYYFTGDRLGGDGVFGSKLVGWAAAWLAIAVMAFTAQRAERDWPWAVSLMAVGCLLGSFGSILTADRADSLLLLFAASALWSVVRLPALIAVALVAFLAGLAADLKLHGPAYMVPACGWWMARHFSLLLPRKRLAAVVAAVGGVAAGFVIPFLPANISATAYLGYVRLASKHGLSPLMFAWNCSLLLCFWIPSLFVLRAVRKEPSFMQHRHLTLFALLLLAAEIAVSVVASKPGAGTHHLLPFVGFHGFLLQQLLVNASSPARAANPSQDSKGPWIEHPVPRAAMAGIAVILVGTAWSTALGLRYILDFDLKWSLQQAQVQELRRFADDYPHGILGIAGNESYALTLFRPWITRQGTLQTDYGAWMDWSLSGVSDAPLVNALQTCRIPYLFVPAGGEPFTMNSTYGTGQPVFSDAVRTGFAHSYTLVHPGQYFNVYGCDVARASLIRRALP